MRTRRDDILIISAIVVLATLVFYLALTAPGPDDIQPVIERHSQEAR